jgi:hypothetical protein
MPCTPVQSGREVDLDHRIVEPAIVGERYADRRIGGQLDDALVIVGKLQLEFRHQHAAAFDPADGANIERHVLAGNEGPGRHEHALHAGARIRCAAHDLHRRAFAGVDHADAKPVGVRVLLGGDHIGDLVGREQFRLGFDLLDLETDHGELVDELFQRLVGVEMLLKPGEGEFHGADSAVGQLATRAALSAPPPLAGEGREGVLASPIALAITVRTPSRLVMTS